MDWPYSEFFQRCSDIFNYIDTHKEFLAITETSMDGGEEQKAMFGQIERWKSRSNRVPSETVYVKINSVWHTCSKYYFNTWTTDELKSLPRPSAAPYRTLIHRTDPGDTEYSQAEWQFSPSGDLIGVVLTCKARDNAEPTSKSVAITLGPLAGGEVTIHSEGSFREYGPEAGIAAYEDAVKKYNAARPKPKLGGGSARKARTFTTRGELPALLWVTGALQCTDSRRDAQGKGSDWFSNEVSVYNIASTPYLLTHVSAEYRFIGETEWKPVGHCTVGKDAFVPAAAHPLAQFPLSLQFDIPSNGPPNHYAARGRSLVASQAPIRVRVTVSDMDGYSATIVQEFLNAPLRVEEPKPEDALFVVADNVVAEERSCAHCTITNEDNTLKVSVASSSINEERLRKLAGEGCAKKVNEVPIDDLQSNYSSYKISATALVDRTCQRVWAIKVDIHRPDCNAHDSGLMLVPLYGKTDPKRQIAIAPPTPTVEGKDNETKTNNGSNADDSHDDVPQGAHRKMRMPPPSTLEQIQLSLRNLEQQITRIADGMKK